MLQSKKKIIVDAILILIATVIVGGIPYYETINTDTIFSITGITKIGVIIATVVFPMISLYFILYYKDICGKR